MEAADLGRWSPLSRIGARADGNAPADARTRFVVTMMCAPGRPMLEVVDEEEPEQRDRGDHLLHTVMALAMAVKPWNGGGMLPEAPTTFFTAAALWFPLTAVSRQRQFELTDVARRLPYAAGMAAMAWMTHLGGRCQRGQRPAAWSPECWRCTSSRALCGR